MLYLLLAICCSASISVMMRLSEKYVKGDVNLLAVNYIVCSFLAALYAGPADLLPAGAGLPFTLGLGLVNGVLYLSGFVLLQWNVKNNGVVLSSTFQKLGVLVPIALSVVLYGEMPGPSQLIGYAMALIAIALIHFDGSDEAGGSRKIFLLLLLLCGGISDSMSKIFEQAGFPEMESHFLFYTFFAALILCLCLVIRRKQKIGKTELLFGLLVGVPNYFSARFLLRSLSYVPAVIAYPTYSVGGIVAVSAAGLLLFHEKLSRRRWLALGIVLVAIVLLNL